MRKKILKLLSVYLAFIVVFISVGDSNYSFADEVNIYVEGVTTEVIGSTGQVPTMSISLSPANGRMVYLQKLNPKNNEWVYKKGIKAPEGYDAQVSIEFPKEWINDLSGKWRIYIPSVEGDGGYVSDVISVKSNRLYNNGKGYLPIKDKITIPESGANLIKGTMGLRVAKVQRYLGMGYRWEIVDAFMMSRVKSFQSKNGLQATGVVDLQTWKTMGFDEESWYTMDAYVSPLKNTDNDTREQIIEKMIDTARAYIGTEYVVGAAGPPGTGIDCSGLVMQAMYSVGIDPAPVSVVRHTTPGYEYESRNLWKHPALKHVSYAERKRGDLIFYSDSRGTIIHVAIYLGDNMVIESWPEKVVVWPIKNSQRARIAGVARIFE